MLKKILIKTKNKKYKIIAGKYSLRNIIHYKDVRNTKMQNIIIVDSIVYKKYKNYIKSIFRFNNSKIIIFKSSEKKKSLIGYNELTNKIFKLKPDRNSRIIIIGGGVIGDLGGFVASTLLRGLDLILVPTTLLSQVDSSIGGKNGINNKFGKNLLGTFYQPDLVIVDTFFLKSLKKRQVKSGYSEIIKHSLIKDKKFFCWLEENYKKILNLQNPFILNAIFKSIKIKADIVKKDEKESLALSGSRVLLNFGHTIGHAIEANNSYKNNLTHGEAISIGMAYATEISFKLNYLTHNNVKKIQKHLKNAGLPIKLKNINNKHINKYVIYDKKILGNKIKFILLKDIGKAFAIKNFTIEKFRKKFSEINR